MPGTLHKTLPCHGTHKLNQTQVLLAFVIILFKDGCSLISKINQLTMLRFDHLILHLLFTSNKKSHLSNSSSQTATNEHVCWSEITRWFCNWAVENSICQIWTSSKWYNTFQKRRQDRIKHSMMCMMAYILNNY